MKRRIEQSFHGCDQYVQLDVMPGQGIKLLHVLKQANMKRTGFIFICPASYIKFIDVIVEIINKTTVHEKTTISTIYENYEYFTFDYTKYSGKRND